MLTSPNRGRGQQKLASSPSGKSSSKQLLTDPSCGQSGASTSNSAHSSRSTSPMNSVFRSLKRARFLRDKFSKRSFSDSSVSMDQTGRIIKGSAGTSPSRFLYPKYEFGVEQRSTSMIVHNNHSPHNRNAAGTVRGNSTIHSPKSGLTSPKPLGRRIQSAFSPPQDGNNKRLTPEDLWSSIGLQLEDGSSGVYSLLNIDVCGCGTSVGGGGGSMFSEPLNLWRENMSDKVPRTPTTNCVRNSTNSGTVQSVGQKHTSERVPLSIKEVEKSSLLCKHTVGHVGVSPLSLSKDQSGSKFTNGAGGHSWMGLVPSYAPPPTLASTIDPSSKSDLPLLSNCAKCMCGASKGMSMTGTNVVGSQPLDRNHLTLVHTTTSGEDNRNQCRSNAGGSCNGHGGGGGSSYAKSPNANISRRVRNDLGTPRCTTRSKKGIANEETTTSIMSCHELVENARLAQGSQSTPKSRDGNNYDLQTSVTRCGRALSSSPSVTCPSFMVPNHETAEPASGVVGGASILRRNHDPSRSRSSSSSSSSVRLDDRGDFGSSSRELQEQRLNCKGIRSGELGAQRPRNSPNANTIEQLEQSRVKGDDEKSEEQECGTEVRADDSSGGRPSPGTTNIFCRHEVVEGCSVGRKPESFNESFDLSSVSNLCATTPQKGSSEQHSWNVTTHGIGIANTLEQIPKNEQINKAEALGSNYQKTTTVERDVVQKPPGQPQTSLRIVSDVPGEMEREELMDRLEQSLGYSTCRLPRVLTVAQRRRAGMVKQWSMDETKSWFYSRSSSLDRQGPHLSTQEEDPSNSGTSSPLTSSAVSSVIGGGSGGGGAAPPPVGISSAAKLSSAGTSLSGEKRRRFFQRKNTCSAPASSTESVDSSLPSRKSSQESSSVSAVSKVLEEVFRTSTLLNWDSDLDIFPSPGASQTIHSHLSSTISPPTIISGLVRSRDGSHLSPNTQPYISLPSPNIQSAKPTVPGGLASHNTDDDEDQGSQLHQSGPDCTHLVRRGALVPPKMDSDDDPGGSSMSNDDEGCGSSHLEQSTNPRITGNNPCSTAISNLEHMGEVPGCGSNTLSVPGSESSCGHKSTGGRSIPPRRSSVVVIPPMQVCPGDLLVYSKALTHRGNYLELDGSTTSLANEQDHSHAVTSSSRKSKNTWSLLKLFDRDKKPKSESPGGLEEVLANMSQSEFTDEQLPRLCGLQWFDFVELVDMERRGRVPWLSNHHHHHHQQQRDLESPRNDLVESLKPDSTQDQQPCSDIDALIGDRDQQQLLDSSEDLVTDLVNVSQSALDSNGTLRSKLAPAHRQRVSRLKRTQSERAPEGGAVLHNLKKFGPNGSSPLAKVVTPLSSRGSSPETKAPDQASVTSLPIASTVTRQRRHNLVHSMSFTAKDIDPTRRILASRESLTREQKRIDSVWDLFQSEIAFLVDHLNVLKHVYMEPLKKVQVEGYIMFAEPEVLFGNLDELCCVTYSFCKEFLHLLLNMVEPDGDLPVSNLMIRLFEKGGRARTLSQAYHRYALNYINALNYLESLRRQPEFCEFEKWCNRDPRCKKLQLTDLLVAPVHHIMKIPLVIKDIEAKTDTPEEKAIIARVLEMKEASLRELDDKMKWLKNFDRLLEIQRNIVWPSVLELDPKQYFPEFLKAALSRQPCERLIVSPRRQILMEGPLFLLDSSKPTDMYLILFDDLLIITRRKKSLSKKKSTLTENWGSVRSSTNDSSMKYIVHKQPLSLDRFFIHDVTPQEAIGAKLEHAFILICLNRFQQIVQVHTFQTETEALKNAWLSKLREAQEIWKRTLQTTIFKGSTSSCGDQDILGAQSTTSPEAAKGAPTLM